jgi:hypothetical protein
MVRVKRENFVSEATMFQLLLFFSVLVTLFYFDFSNYSFTFIIVQPFVLAKGKKSR